MPFEPKSEQRVRVITDTNIAVSGLVWGGPPLQVLNAARNGTITLYTSPVLIAELQDVLGRPKMSQPLQRIRATPASLIHSYRSFVQLIDPAAIGPGVLADPDDDAVLACAVAARADAIVSGDHHLLDLKVYQQIPILTPRALLPLIGSSTP